MGDCYLEPEQDYAGQTGQAPPASVMQPQNIWPVTGAPWWREGLYSYYHCMLPLARRLVRIFALALDLPEGEAGLDHMFRFPITGMRPLYYPPTPVGEGDGGEPASVGLGAHADFSCAFVPRTLSLRGPFCHP